MSHRKALFVALPLLACLSAPSFAAPDSVGAITKSRGEVELTRDGKTAGTKTKDEIFANDHIKTGPRGLLVAKLKDDTKMVLGNNADMVVQELQYEKDAKDNKVTLEVAKGAFRFVSGLTAKGNPEAMKVKLGKLATIGVRGTHFGGEVTEEGAKVMLLKPEDGTDRPTAIIVTNQFGSVTIDRPGLGTNLAPNKPPTEPAKMDLPVVVCPLFN